MSKKITVIAKGQPVEFETPFMDAEAFTVVATLVASGKGGSFAADLVRKGGRCGATLSPKQMAWIHKIAVDATTPKAVVPSPGVEKLRLQKVILMLMYAKEVGELKHPCIRIELEGLPGLKFTIAGPMARFPGTVNIVRISDGKWLGRIHKNGTVEPRDIDPQVVQVLQALENDPLAAATMHGRRTGNCCFCGRELTAKDSLVAGYGPICAENFGLPHAGLGEGEEWGIFKLLKEWSKETAVAKEPVRTVTSELIGCETCGHTPYDHDNGACRSTGCNCQEFKMSKPSPETAGVWTRTDEGWVADSSDRPMSLPNGEPCPPLDQWVAQHDQDNDTVCWMLRRDGTLYTVLND